MSVLDARTVTRWREAMARHSRSSESAGQQSVRDKIRRWLLQGGQSVVDETPQGAIWGLKSVDPQGRILTVGQGPEHPQSVIINGGVAFSETHQQRFNMLPPEERREFLWSMRFELLRLGVGFSGVAEPLRQVWIYSGIYLDGLTQDRFAERAGRVQDGILAVIWMLGRLFKEEPTEESPSGFGVN